MSLAFEPPCFHTNPGADRVFLAGASVGDDRRAGWQAARAVPVSGSSAAERARTCGPRLASSVAATCTVRACAEKGAC